MSYKHIPELAEMLTPPDNRFEMLRQRFEHRASFGRDGRIEWVNNAISEAYKQCADELARVLAGETPPAPGMVWKTKENGK